MRLRLQKQIGRRFKGKSYYKYVVVIPSKVIKKSRLGNRTEINVGIK